MRSKLLVVVLLFVAVGLFGQETLKELYPEFWRDSKATEKLYLPELKETSTYYFYTVTWLASNDELASIAFLTAFLSELETIDNQNIYLPDFTTFETFENTKHLSSAVKKAMEMHGANVSVTIAKGWLYINIAIPYISTAGNEFYKYYTTLVGFKEVAIGL